MKFTTNTPDLNLEGKRLNYYKNLNSLIVILYIVVKHLIESSQKTTETALEDLPIKTESVSELKKICLNLLDSLNEKSLELSHQKKANK